MTRVPGPAGQFAPGKSLTSWVLLAGLWAAIGFFAVVWAAAAVVAAATGGRVADFGMPFAVDVVAGRPEQAWPGTSTPLVAAVAVVFVSVAGWAVWRLVRLVIDRLPRDGDPVRALARNRHLAELAPAKAAATATRLRESLADTPPSSITGGEIGLELGRQILPNGLGPPLRSSWEDTEIDFMGTRSGKTTARAVPSVLSAPGAVVATSNKADLWAATAELRERDRGGTSWLFDPQQITYQPQRFWVDLLHGVDSVEAADRLAGHFVLTVDDGTKRDLWGPAATELLCALFLAAASSGRTLRHVGRWLDEPAVPTPAELLADAGFELVASALRGMQTGATETRDGIYQTARTAAKALRDETILAWVTPPAGRPLPRLDTDAFPTSTDTLYLLSKSRSPAAPLIAALTDRVMRAGVVAAERMGERLDPPMVVMLDEAANICRIADLPELYSHLGSRGIVIVTILQSYEQGKAVWGEDGMAAMWGAATKLLIGAGVRSPRLVRDLATLVGQHDVTVRSLTYGDRYANEQISLRRQDILEPAAIGALERGDALLLSSGMRPVLIRLPAWYDSARAGEITTHRDAARQKIITEACRAAGPGAPPTDLSALKEDL